MTDTIALKKDTESFPLVLAMWRLVHISSLAVGTIEPAPPSPLSDISETTGNQTTGNLHFLPTHLWLAHNNVRSIRPRSSLNRWLAHNNVKRKQVFDWRQCHKNRVRTSNQNIVEPILSLCGGSRIVMEGPPSSRPTASRRRLPHGKVKQKQAPSSSNSKVLSCGFSFIFMSTSVLFGSVFCFCSFCFVLGVSVCFHVSVCFRINFPVLQSVLWLPCIVSRNWRRNRTIWPLCQTSFQLWLLGTVAKKRTGTEASLGFEVAFWCN